MPRGRPRKADSVLMKSAEFIGWALGGLEREIAETRERLALLNQQAAALRARTGTGGGRAGSAAALPTFDEPGARKERRRRRRKMSAAGRRRISEMMKKRWADVRKRGKKTLKG